jgi:arylsulfatase A-like enzyme
VIDTLGQAAVVGRTPRNNGALWRREDIERFGHRANGPFSGTKGTAYEGGHRVPFIVKWPGKVPASRVSRALINHTDFPATLGELFKVDVAKSYPGSALDSYSLLPVLQDPDKELDRPGMVATQKSYRNRDWKIRFVRG